MKILYIHHGRVLGGAPTSLLFTIQGLKKISDCDVKVLCVFDDMKEFFRKGAGIEVGEINDPCLILGRVLIGWASIYNITTLKQLLREVFNLKKSIHLQIETLRKEKPDIVHLNSSILFTTAIAAYKLKIPVVWHVREILYGKRFNLRKVFSGYLIRKYADRVIAIDNAEAKSLGRDKFNKV
ncbi:MAG: glycosyltransferase, partial [Nitrospirae bacterium]|nr:glycosyltransferase [Nitrospirota bacterium]